MDGAVSIDKQVIGSYLHGLFDHPESLQALLQWAGLEQAQRVDLEQLREASLERLADTLEQHLQLEQLFSDVKY
jgi:adenosylcobyric acid synthase